jgi:hypothetical protein
VAADEGMEEFEFRGFDGVLGLMDTDNVWIVDLQVEFFHWGRVVVVGVCWGDLEEDFPAVWSRPTF